MSNRRCHRSIETSRKTNDGSANPSRNGQSNNMDELTAKTTWCAAPFYIRFCFPDAATADAFRNRFGGECSTHAPAQPKPRTSATSSDAPAVKREAGEDWRK